MASLDDYKNLVKAGKLTPGEAYLKIQQERGRCVDFGPFDKERFGELRDASKFFERWLICLYLEEHGLVPKGEGHE